MGLKSMLIKPFAKKIIRDVRKWSSTPLICQQQILEHLIKQGAKTKFGKDHGFDQIRSYADFQKQVPIRNYEDLRSYIDDIRAGQKDILWPGMPNFFAKTSGTTSGVKYIPMTKESTPFHVNTARNGLFNHFIETGNGSYFDGKMIYLSGSPVLQKVNGINTGRLSGIVNHQIPSWAQGNKLPSHEVNCIEDWEEKVEAIVRESAHEDVRLVGGIPPWVQMYYESLLRFTGKSTVKEVFPNLSLFVYGGVNFEPYRSKLEELVGGRIDSLETFPASEGFFAYQDKYPHEGLLLNVNAGMYFEFIPVSEYGKPEAQRLNLSQVEKGVNYALIINSNAGLWGYDIGDTVEFVSLEPYRCIVSGRIKHFISAFGEHVIGKEVEEAMLKAINTLDLKIVEFTVAPQVNPEDGSLPYHEWLIEFASPPDDLSRVQQVIDESIQEQNIYYLDLIQGNILQPAKITSLPPQAFRKYMESQGKLGGQNKVPRLSNDRKIADFLRGLQQ